MCRLEYLTTTPPLTIVYVKLSISRLQAVRWQTQLLPHIACKNQSIVRYRLMSVLPKSSRTERTSQIRKHDKNPGQYQAIRLTCDIVCHKLRDFFIPARLNFSDLPAFPQFWPGQPAWCTGGTIARTRKVATALYTYLYNVSSKSNRIVATG